MNKIKISLVVIVLLTSVFSSFRSRHRDDYAYNVTGTDIFTGNYIVTTSAITCVPLPLGPCFISSSVPATTINGNLEVSPSTSTILGRGLAL